MCGLTAGLQLRNDTRFSCGFWNREKFDVRFANAWTGSLATLLTPCALLCAVLCCVLM